jgi:hypothetical protein
MLGDADLGLCFRNTISVLGDMSPNGKRCHATALQIERLLQEVFLLEK